MASVRPLPPLGGGWVGGLPGGGAGEDAHRHSAIGVMAFSPKITPLPWFSCGRRTPPSLPLGGGGTDRVCGWGGGLASVRLLPLQGEVGWGSRLAPIYPSCPRTQSHRVHSSPISPHWLRVATNNRGEFGGRGRWSHRPWADPTSLVPLLEGQPRSDSQKPHRMRRGDVSLTNITMRHISPHASHRPA